VNSTIIGAVVTSYCVGAIPSGYIIARLKGIEDIRKHGSGNIGATNVSRILGKYYFFLIFLFDAGKALGLLSILSHYFSTEYLYIFALMILLGNGYSVFLQGTGGKGVATMCGILAGIDMYALGIFLLGWIATLGITQTVGIASVIGALLLPLYGLFLINSRESFFLLLLFVWIAWTHRLNIAVYWKKHCIKE
jgi:glycerol-3-phosphate acyltransferase PlsY